MYQESERFKRGYCFTKTLPRALPPRHCIGGSSQAYLWGSRLFAGREGETNEDEALEVRAGAVCAGGCVDDGSECVGDVWFANETDQTYGLAPAIWRGASVTGPDGA